MTQFEREVSNLSYTNKDFSTIYPELLDLAKKLSNILKIYAKNV